MQHIDDVQRVLMKDISKTFTVSTTGASWPRLGFGTWKTTPAELAREATYLAIKNGYRHIDCAGQYGNERCIGQAIQRASDEGLVKREDLWITSKLWNTYHRPEHVEEACRRSLADLQLDYLDLYLIHFPIPLKYVSPEKKYPPEFVNDPDDPRVIIDPVPLMETWRAMETLVDKGLVRHLGVSNFDLQLLQDLLTYCKHRPITNQVELHPYLQQKPMVTFCERMNIAVTAYSPLGGKSYITAGKTHEGEPPALEHPIIKEIAERHNRTTAQIILRWDLQRSPIILTIPKSGNADRAKQNAQVFDFVLSDDDMERIAQLDSYRRYNDPAQYPNADASSWPIFA